MQPTIATYLSYVFLITLAILHFTEAHPDHSHPSKHSHPPKNPQPPPQPQPPKPPAQCTTELYVEFGGAKIPVSTSVSCNGPSCPPCPKCPDGPVCSDCPVCPVCPSCPIPEVCPTCTPCKTSVPPCDLSKCQLADIDPTIALDPDDYTVAYGCPCFKGETPKRIPLNDKTLEFNLTTGCPFVNGSTKNIDSIRYTYYCGKTFKKSGKWDPTIVANLNECTQKCNNEMQCKGLVFLPAAVNWTARAGEPPTNVPAKSCWLGYDVGTSDLQEASGSLTLVKLGDDSEVETGCPVIDGATKTISGTPYVHYCNQNLGNLVSITVTSLSQCAEMCSADQNCKGLTYSPRASSWSFGEAGAVNDYPPHTCWYDNGPGIATMIPNDGEQRTITIVKAIQKDTVTEKNPDTEPDTNTNTGGDTLPPGGTPPQEEL